jgi:23S rRNA (pseudouridine1915-N3)-methyltransferase
MKTFLIAYGKLKTPGARELTDYYLRNIRPWMDVTEVELPFTKVQGKSASEKLRARSEETETLRTYIEKKTTRSRKLILLDETGKSFSTLQLTDKISTFQDSGTTEVFFVVGSSYGFSDEIRKSADLLWCLGAQTLSHEIARAVLSEQLYRIWSVLKNHPYHNEG